jgi:DNA-directed RNA polymerase subunit RPC12/RpoP
MLALALVEEIERLLAEGSLSQRKIAERMDVSRGTVSAIANGRRGNWGREADDADHPPAGPPVRCQKCGYRVVMPCIICEARQYQSRRLAMRKLVPRVPVSTVPARPGRTALPIRARRVA